MSSIVTKRNDLVEAPYDNKFMGQYIAPVLKVSQESGTFYFQKTQSDTSGVRSKGDAMTANIAAPGKVAYECAIVYENKLVPTQDEGEVDEISLVGDAKTSVTAKIEALIAGVLAAIEDPTPIKADIVAGIATARRAIASKAVSGKNALILSESNFQTLFADADISAVAAKFNVAYSPDLPGGGDAQLLARALGFDVCLVIADAYATATETTIFVAKIPANTADAKSSVQLMRTLTKGNGDSLWNVEQYANGTNGGDQYTVSSYCVPKLLNSDLVIALDINAEVPVVPPVGG